MAFWYTLRKSSDQLLLFFENDPWTDQAGDYQSKNK